MPEITKAQCYPDWKVTLLKLQDSAQIPKEVCGTVRNPLLKGYIGKH